MARLDLDDLPPKLAALLAGAAEGEEVLLVKDGAVVGRLTAGPAPKPPSEPPPPPEEDIKQVFEDFRSAVEDEF
jgi:antitoxin (DNA-binding transcriptional repressor) of toxin-antitoxin stability system